MKDKDYKMLQEAYSKIVIKEEEDPSEYNSRYYDEGRASRTYEMHDLDFEFKYKINGKDWVISSNLDYEVEDPGDDAAWEWHDFTVHSIAYYNEDSGDYVEINPQEQPLLYKTLEDATAEAFQTNSDNWL